MHFRIVVGASDGSVTVLVLADPSPDNHSATVKYLKNLVSRKTERSESQDSANPFRVRRDPRIRFRAVARTALHMDRVVQNIKALEEGPVAKKKLAYCNDMCINEIRK